ncbi:hypothetical protein Golob_026215 [Gossypium lobatum]|uniref:Uncharacterized protein n=1 Tax=Gossypium lobatum TaxID=34289 RepID=A0A7J8LUF7_9ROSI|nr:hypothetical protein [Gossypium lobatum]
MINRGKMTMSTLPLMIFRLQTLFLYCLLRCVEDVNSSLSTLETQLAHFPSMPPFSPHHDV